MVNIIVIPVDAIRIDIFEILIISWVDSSGIILNHAEEEHITRAALTLTTDSDSVMVPSFSPFKSVLVNGVKKKMMEKPYMSIGITIKPIMQFQILEEKLPLGTKTAGQIAP